MSHKIFRPLLVAILLIGLVAVEKPLVARAAGPWYVSTTGDDNNDCLGPSTPCATINAAIGKTSSGDIVYVAEGIYTGPGDQVVLMDRNITLSGGWDSTFISPDGFSIINGEHLRKGIYVNDGVTATIEGFIIQNGSAVQGSGPSLHGGGIYNDGTLTLRSVVVTQNTAQNGGGISNGGGYSNSVGDLTLENTWVEGNSSRDAAGGIYNYIGSLILNNSTVSNNTTGDAGGGIMNFCCSGPTGGTVILNNSTISTNFANRGGGITNAGSLTANNSTISGNTISGGFGFGSAGIENGGTVTLKNSILAGNTAPPNIPGQDCSGPINSSGFNILGNASGCTFNTSGGDIINVDARLGALIGSPGYQPLRSDSPAVDAGNPAGCTDQSGNPLTTDQRGVARLGTCDIGAYEYTVPGAVAELSILGGNFQSALTGLSFASPLQVATLDSQGSPVEGVTVDFAAPESGPSGTFADTGTNITSAVSTSSAIATTSILTANDQAGNYTVSASATGAGSVNFNLEHLARPANDDFANAEVINLLPFNVTVDNTNATAEPNERSNCGLPTRTLWYSFTPASDMTVQASLAGGSPSGGVLSIYLASGPAPSDLTALGCLYTGGSTNFGVSAGSTYYLQADGAFGQAGTLQIGLQQITAPANDNFANAETVTGFPFNATTDNTNATTQPGEPQGCSFPFRSVWYTFTPTENMVLQLNIDGQANATANIFVDNGSGLSGLTSLTCAYMGAGNARNFQVDVGTKYYLRLDTGGQPGPIQVNLQPFTPPANDRFDGVEDIASLPFSVVLDNTSASMELGETSVCGFPFRSVWYAFTPSETMTAQIQNTGQVYGAIDIFRADGPGIADLTFLGCAFNGGGSTNIRLEAGETYYLRVDTNGTAGSLQFNIERIFPPGNDDFANAEEIGSLPFNISVNNSDATLEPNEPMGCGVQNKSIWYSFTPTENVLVQANTAGSAVSGLIEIYQATGTGISGLLFLGCAGSNPTHVQLEAGRTYYLKVDSFGPAGLIQVNLERMNPPENDNLANAESITAQPFHATVDITDATNEPSEPVACYYMPNTVWYSFTPSVTTKMRADTLGSTVSGNVNIYHSIGNGFPGLQFIQCAGFGGVATFIAEAGQTYYFQVGGTGQAGEIQFNLAEVPAISGRLTDAATGAPLPGNTEPFAVVTLFRVCGDSCLEFVDSQSADGEGRFLFDSYYSGTLLSPGTYQIQATASLYQTEQSEPFELADSSLDVGDLALHLLQTQVHVSIDVVPGSATNIINLRSSSVAVAILSAPGFDASTMVDRASLRFGKTGDETSLQSCNRKAAQDVNGDGLYDLICYFSVQAGGFSVGDTLGILTGMTVGDIPLEGSDTVTMRNKR